MLKNLTVIEGFLFRKPCKSENLTSTGDKLFTYDTCLAQWTDSYLIINMTRYSTSSSSHFNILWALCCKYLKKHERECVDSVPKNTKDLLDYVNSKRHEIM